MKVDHVRHYKQPKREEGEELTQEEERRLGFNVAPQELIPGYDSSTGSDGEGNENDGSNARMEITNFAEGLDPEDPMYEYIIQQRMEEAGSK